MPDRIPDLKDWVGGSQEAADLVLTERCVALAAALGEPTVDLQDGGVLPPLRHWLYFWDIVARDRLGRDGHPALGGFLPDRSEEHTSELQSLMRISYAVFCLKKKKKTT